MSNDLFRPEHEVWRQTIKEFIENELAPNAEEWEEAREVPREIFKRMGELGYLGMRYPEEYGGGGGDILAEAIMHEEMPRPGANGRMGGFQLWVNLPAELKMTRPRYQDLSAAQIPEVRRADGTVIRVVAGEVDGVAGAVTEIYAEPEYLDVSLPAGVSFSQPVPRGHSAFAYAFEGEGQFGVGCDLGYRGDLDGELLTAPRMAVFGDGDEVRVEARDHALRFLLVSGKPLGEPIARYGPFVMNTREELQLALRDLQNDTFVWRDDAQWAGRRRTWSR